jgi:predicted transcriptional regulator
MSDAVQLTEPQLAVLRVVWARGEAAVPEIWRALYAERGLAQSTVATMVARLEKRGVLARRPDTEGRQYVYRATVSEGEVRTSMVAGLTDALFGGDARALVSHLLSARRLRPDDLDEVRRMLAESADDALGDDAPGSDAPGGGETVRGETVRGETVRGETVRRDTARGETPGRGSDA